MLRLALCAGLLAAPALAQQPEDEWQPLPNAPVPPAAPGPSMPAPPLPVLPQPEFVAPARPTLQELRAKLRAREEPNSVSMFGAPSLGQWKRGQAFTLGYPHFQVRAALGLLENLDVGVAYESLYLMSHELRGFVKYGFGKGSGFSVALIVEGGGSFFTTRASREMRGPRWITGRRNYNLMPGVILTTQASSPRAARLFLDLRYLVAFDLEPFSATPLEGVPASVIVGHNVTARLGAELPLTERSAFLFSFGLDLHFRPVDSPVMPHVAVGIVTGF